MSSFLFYQGGVPSLVLHLHSVVFESMSLDVQWSASEAQLTAEFGHVISPLSTSVPSLMRWHD